MILRFEHLFHFEDFLRFPFGQAGERECRFVWRRYCATSSSSTIDLMFFFIALPFGANLLRAVRAVFFLCRAVWPLFHIPVCRSPLLWRGATSSISASSLVMILRLMHHRDARFSASFIEKVDRLIGQKASCRCSDRKDRQQLSPRHPYRCTCDALHISF